jgi:hypothetical protein
MVNIGKLLENGAIIIGKSNLSVCPCFFEAPALTNNVANPAPGVLCIQVSCSVRPLRTVHENSAKNCRGEKLIDGFSPVGGQTMSPYIYGDIQLDEGDLSPSVSS